MKNDKFSLLRRILGILIAVSIVTAGICLIVGCLSIYNSGDQPYSRQAVADAFKTIAIPVYICLILTVLGMVFELVSPSQPKKEKNIPNNRAILKKLSAKKDIQGDKRAQMRIQEERKHRKSNNIFAFVLIAVTCAIMLMYALIPENYHSEEINQSVIHVLKFILPCYLMLALCGTFTLFMNERSIKREIELLKELPMNSQKSTPEKQPKSNIKVIRYAILVVSLGFLVYGFAFGGTEDVLTKAVNICTECIGLG